MPSSTWKNAERKVAAIFGTKRIPAAANAQRDDRGDNAPDAETDQLAIQIKSGYAFPAYLRTWLDGINKMTPAGKTGVLVWHRRGGKFADAMVMLKASDFQRLLAAARELDAVLDGPLRDHDDRPPAL